jgi:hypothetical protein
MRLLLVHLRLQNKGSNLPVVCTLIARPHHTLFVLSVAWLHHGFNQWHPWPLELILAWPTAAGNLTQRRQAQAKVRVRADVVVHTKTIERHFWQDHLIIQNGSDICHCVALVVVA